MEKYLLETNCYVVLSQFVAKHFPLENNKEVLGNTLSPDGLLWNFLGALENSVFFSLHTDHI